MVCFICFSYVFIFWFIFEIIFLDYFQFKYLFAFFCSEGHPVRVRNRIMGCVFETCVAFFRSSYRFLVCLECS